MFLKVTFLPSIVKVFFCKFGLKTRFVCRCDSETLFPNMMPLPVISHLAIDGFYHKRRVNARVLRYNVVMKQKTTTKAIVNRRASFDYALGDDLVVGVELTGGETKAARLGHVQLKGAYVAIKQDQLWLVNASFTVLHNLPKGSSEPAKSVDTRDRRILAHRKQIDKFIERKKQGYTIVPKKLLTEGRFIKLVIAEGKGKKNYDKRQTIKKRDFERKKLI